MSFDPDLLIKMGDVREVIRDELAGKVTAVELIHILFELKKHAFPAGNKTDKTDEKGGKDFEEDKSSTTEVRSASLADKKEEN